MVNKEEKIKNYCVMYLFDSILITAQKLRQLKLYYTINKTRKAY